MLAMATFNQLLQQPFNPQQALEQRQQLISEIVALTGRNLMLYMVDFNKGSGPITNSIDREDKIGFSDMLEGLDGQPIDIIMHSPGGSPEAAEELVKMIRDNHDDVRFIVPGNAMSAATLMALSGNFILMDERSSLGPIDPQVPMPLPTGGSRFVPAQTILDGFEKAKEVITKEGPAALPTYLPLLNKYDLHLLEICDNAKALSYTLACDWLKKYMLADLPETERETQAHGIATYLNNHKDFLSHGRAIDINKATEIGLKIIDMRSNPELRTKIWDLFCASINFLNFGAVKMFENSLGVDWSRRINIQPGPQILIQQGFMPMPLIPPPAAAPPIPEATPV
jgi:hypothetical protein